MVYQSPPIGSFSSHLYKRTMALIHARRPRSASVRVRQGWPAAFRPGPRCRRDQAPRKRRNGQGDQELWPRDWVSGPPRRVERCAKWGLGSGGGSAKLKATSGGQHQSRATCTTAQLGRIEADCLRLCFLRAAMFPTSRAHPRCSEVASRPSTPPFTEVRLSAEMLAFDGRADRVLYGRNPRP